MSKSHPLAGHVQRFYEALNAATGVRVEEVFVSSEDNTIGVRFEGDTGQNQEDFETLSGLEASVTKHSNGKQSVLFGRPREDK